MDNVTIRTDASLLPQHQGKIVRIIGKCESYDASSRHTTLNSNGPIRLALTGNDLFTVGNNYEIIGQVSSDAASVRVMSVIELSDNVNFDVVKKLVQYAQKVPELYA